MQLVNLPAPLDIVHDGGTDFAKRFNFPSLMLSSSWGAEVLITLPSGQSYKLTMGDGMSIDNAKVIWVLSADELRRFAGKTGTTYKLILIAPDGTRKSYLRGLLTIQ